MRKSIFYLTLTMLFLGNFSLCLAQGHHKDKATTHKKAHLLSDKDLRKGMNILIKAVTSDLPKNDFFKDPQHIKKFIDIAINAANVNGKALTCLSEILRAVSKAKKVNTKNFPPDLINRMRKVVSTIYHQQHKNLSHLISKNPKKAPSSKITWKGMATGDILAAGRFLVALKAGELTSSQSTFKQDFESHFSNAARLYAISPSLKKFIAANSKRLTKLKNNSHALQTYQYDKMLTLVFNNHIDEAIKQASKNVMQNDYVSLFFIEALATLGIDEAVESLAQLTKTFKVNKPKVVAYIKQDYLKEYYNLYGKKHSSAKASQKDSEEPVTPLKKDVKETPKTPASAPTYTIEAGPIWNQHDAESKCPSTCKSAIEWNGQWATTEPGKMSVCGTKPQKKGAPSSLDIKAGPIWNQQDAEKKCPNVISSGLTWTGPWWTTVPGRMSVCTCTVKDKS